MERYNYQAAICDDIRNYIETELDWKDFSDMDEVSDYLNDTLWVEDAVTGNASGSYFFNAWKAEEAVCHNLDLLADAIEEFGDGNNEEYKSCLKSAETADVTIRCYLLGGCISEVLNEYDFDEMHGTDEDEDND